MRARDVLLFWLPLFASWLLMTAEGPLISAAVNRLPEEVVMLAALGIVFSLAVTIESPIIHLLATSTALVQDRGSFLLVRRFTVHWMLLLTAVAAAVAFTPLFGAVVPGLLGTPPEVASWVRPGLQILTLWTAAIAWRRFLQGVLIHFGQTRRVARGTVVRLVVSGGTVALLALWGEWPGVVIGATALMAGVAAEALYATVAVRPILRRELAPSPEPGPRRHRLTYRELFWFHLPLAGTSVLTLLAQPLVTSSLARLEHPTASLAAWPLVFQLMLLTRAAAFALPEAVIALHRGEATHRPIRRFALVLAAATLAAMAVFVLSPAAGFYLREMQSADDEVAALARLGLVLFLPLPALDTLVSWLRGLLIGARATRAVNAGMAVRLTVTSTVLGLGLLLGTPGIPTAALALDLAAFAELLYLLRRRRRE